jgi:GT2 family glycosyltransferase
MSKITQNIDISIIIVNFNGGRYIDSCLDSIFENNPSYSYEIIVIDNSSADNSLDVLSHYKDKITLIPNVNNMGFSYANNQGIKIAIGKYIFLLNNDTVLKPESLDTMINYFAQNSNIGAIAPKLLNADGSIQLPGSILGHWQYKNNKPRKVGFLSGAAFLTTKDIMSKIGGLDENFFFYNEDIDLCMQIKKLGLSLIYLPLAKIVHYGGESTKTRKAASVIEGYRGGLYLCFKHYNTVVYNSYRLILLVDLIPRIIWHGLFSFISNRHRDMLKAYVKVLGINIKNDIYYKREGVL